jgi:hypothetical protein
MVRTAEVLTRFGNGAVVVAPRWGSFCGAMKAEPNRPTAGDMRGLMAELGELVEDLGLQTPRPAAPVAPPDDATPQPHAALAEPPATVPMWESASAEDTPGALLWEAFGNELEAPSGSPRPWSPAAAMVLLQPAGPERARVAGNAGQVADRPSLWQRRPHLFTVVTVTAVLVAAAVFAFSRLDLGHTSGPPQAIAQSAFEVTGLRTVSAKSPQQVAGAPTARRFLSSANAIYLDINYRNVTPRDALRIVILLQPDQNGETPSTVSDNTHTGLDSGGEIALTVEAPPGGFAPGTYTVRALHDDHLEQTWTFEVAQAGGRSTP